MDLSSSVAPGEVLVAHERLRRILPADAGSIRHPQVGDELLIPTGAIHSARNIGKTTARWLYGYRECR